jgi:Zn-dependent protease
VHISLIILLIFMVQDYGFIYGMLVALGLLVSIVLHELGHSIVAIKKGCRVREITLMFMGGAAQMERIPTKPLDEFFMALAGPAVSLVLGIVCMFGGARLNLVVLLPINMNIVQFIGLINLMLVFFNLLPAFPMDGGRVLRATLTPKLGRLKATFYAARLGKILAVFFGIFGFISSLTDITNLIMVAIAFFIYTAAGSEYRMVQMQEAAKRQGFGGWSPFDAFWNENIQEDPEDKVIISPPPFKKGPDSEADLRPFKKDPFSDLFGH